MERVQFHDLFAAAFIVYFPDLVAVMLAVFLSNCTINKIFVHVVYTEVV